MRQRASSLNSQHTTPLNQAGQVTILGTLLRLDDAPCDAHHRTRQDFEFAARVARSELRAACDLARLGGAAGGDCRRRSRLVHWRLDTLDLKQVEALLDELHA